MALFTKRSERDVELFQELTQSLALERADNREMSESIRDLQRAVDEMGWRPLGAQGYDESGIALDSLRRAAQTTRSLLAANPLVKRGVKARIGYVWGEGVNVTGRSVNRLLHSVHRALLAPVAQAENEGAAATDGNVFFHLKKNTREIFRIPMSQIGEFACDPEHPDVVWFVKRSWNVNTVDIETGSFENRRYQIWYPTLDYLDSGNGLPAMIKNIPVEQSEAIHVETFNKQIGWTWGVPDLLPALFWSKAYKEFLESQYTLVRSLARFAYKVTDSRPTGAAAKKAAIKIASPQNHDRATGQRSDAGGTVSMGGGVDLIAINKAGANVNFDVGKPLAAMVASALEVPLTTILSEGNAQTDDSLDMPTVKSAQARQAQWAEAIARMLEYLGAKNVKVQFPPIQAAPIHRVIQSIVTAASAGVLFPKEVRLLIIKAMHSYGIEPQAGMPDPGEWQNYASPVHAGTSPQSTPDDTDSAPDGSRTSGGPLADGDHELRPSQ